MVLGNLTLLAADYLYLTAEQHILAFDFMPNSRDNGQGQITTDGDSCQGSATEKEFRVEQLSYRPNEAAKVMGLSRDVVFRLIGSGELKSFRVGAARVIPASAIQEWMAQKLNMAGSHR